MGYGRRNLNRRCTMKTFYRTICAAAFSAMLIACSTDENYTNTDGLSSLIRVAEFPAYGAGTKAVGTADEGKHSWDRGDVILLEIGDQKAGIAYQGSGMWEFTAAVTLSGSATVTAYYAPDYEWSGDAFALKDGESAGLDEFLTYSYEDSDLSDGIDIVFSGSREYSRLRVASVPGASVSLSGAFIPVNAEAAIGQTAVSTVTDANGNAFFYGTWEDQANLKFTVGSSDFDKILSASVGNKSYVLRAGGYSYDEGTATYHIADAEGLAAFSAAIAGNPDVNAELFDDITLAAGEESAAWTTIASDYAGTFDGRGFSIKGLDAPFAASISGTVQNVKFTGVNIAADGTENCGAVTKYLTGSILNTAVTGTITALNDATETDTGLGGYVGQAAGSAKIDNCYANINIITRTNFATGGLVGVIKDAEAINISKSTVEGEITNETTTTRVGGILGRKQNVSSNFNNTIEDCLVSARIDISGNAAYVGGIMGSIGGTRGVSINRCAFTGTVMAGRYVGGIYGSGEFATDCYVHGTVRSLNETTPYPAAGIAGYAQRDLTRCVVDGGTVKGHDSNSNHISGIATYGAGTVNINNCAVIGPKFSAGGFAIYGPAENESVACSGNKYWDISYEDGAAYAPAGNTQDGEAFASAPVQADFEAMGYDFTTVWKWNTRNGAPELRNVGCSDDVVAVEEVAE